MISMTVAYANGRVIGHEERIPWFLPDDLRHFKRQRLIKGMWALVLHLLIERALA